MSLTATAKWLYYDSNIYFPKDQREAIYKYMIDRQQKDNMKKPITNELEIFECGVHLPNNQLAN